MGDFPYASPGDFRRALRDKLKALAEHDDRYTLDEPQRQFAYDRALARLFTSPDAEGWESGLGWTDGVRFRTPW